VKYNKKFRVATNWELKILKNKENQMALEDKAKLLLKTLKVKPKKL